MTTSQWKWIAAAAAAAAVVVLFVLLGTTAEHLLLGWLYFPFRVVPQMTADWPAAILGLAALAAFVAGLHVMLRWFLRVSGPPDSVPRHWSWRSTLAVAVILLLLFVAGTAMVGATHQTIWLMTGRTNSAAEKQPVRGLLDLAVMEGQKVQSANNLKMFGIGVHTFHDTWKALPPGGTMNQEGQLLHGWAIVIGPGTGYYAEQIDYSVPWNQPPNDRIYKCNLHVFSNPALPGPHFDDEGFGLSHYAGNVHVLPIRQVSFAGANQPASLTDSMAALQTTGRAIGFAAVKDGSSHTLMVGTVATQFKPWGHPANVRDPARGINRHGDGFGGPRAWGGAQFVLCDGSVRFLSDKIDPRVLAQLGTPDGGEEVAMDELEIDAE